MELVVLAPDAGQLKDVPQDVPGCPGRSSNRKERESNCQTEDDHVFLKSGTITTTRKYGDMTILKSNGMSDLPFCHLAAFPARWAGPLSMMIYRINEYKKNYKSASIPLYCCSSIPHTYRVVWSHGPDGMAGQGGNSKQLWGHLMHSLGERIKKIHINKDLPSQALEV